MEHPALFSGFPASFLIPAAFLLFPPAFGQDLRFTTPPKVAPVPGGAVEWSAAVSCENPVALIGARVAFALDFDLDGAADASDSLGVSPADCSEDEDGAVALRRVLRPAHPAVLRAELRAPSGAAAASHSVLTAGKGSLLAIARYCARPKNGEPEWVEVRNKTAFPIPLAKVRLEGRVLSGLLAPGEGFTAGSDTGELRLWQPGARIVALSSWSNLRNTADTIRLSLDGGLVLDSVIYGSGAYPLEDCASLADEGSGASAHGYELELPSARWKPRAGAFPVNVRAPEGGRYDLRVYDLDGLERCALARNATGSSSFSLPHPACAGLDARRGAFILHLQPSTSPGVRKVFRITE